MLTWFSPWERGLFEDYIAVDGGRPSHAGSVLLLPGCHEQAFQDQLDWANYATGRRTFIPTHEQVVLIRRHGLCSKPRRDTGRQLPNASGPMFSCIIDMTYLC